MKLKEYLNGVSKTMNPYCNGKVQLESTPIPKGAKSVKDPSEVPKGWSTIRGGRGGIYAIPPSGDKEKEPDKDPKKWALRGGVPGKEEPKKEPPVKGDPRHRILRDGGY